jgi:transposase
MFIKYERKTLASGKVRTYVRVVEGYRDNVGISRIRNIKNYGYLEDQENKEVFVSNIKKDILLLEESFKSDITIKIRKEDNTNNSEYNKIFNYGYRYLESVYDSLHIDEFLDNYQNTINEKLTYNLKDVFKFYCIERILSPDSKRASFNNIDSYYLKNYNFSLDISYRSLEYLATIFDSLQAHLRNNVDKIFITNYEKIYYDVTNYYCEIDKEDSNLNLRHRGVSKEHRVDPIIGLGLFMDSAGLPIQVNVFNGNISEGLTLIPCLKELKNKYNKSRVILVADKGLNSSKNITHLLSSGDGYIFSQILKGKKGKRYQDELFNNDNWIKVSENYKYKLYIEEINGIKQKVLIYWSKDNSDRDKKKRDEKVFKALNSLTNGAYSVQHGYEKYLEVGLLTKDTGIKYTKEELKAYRELDINKIKSDELYDGFNCIITSELEYSESNIRQYYHELWEIEQTFRITKTDLEFRPIYHYKKTHILSHFLICYTSLLILRLLQYKLKTKQINLSVERIVNVLKRLNLDTPNKSIVHLHSVGENEVWDDYNLLNISFKLDYNKAYEKVEKFKKHLKSIIFA